MTISFDEVGVFAGAFILSALAGLASLLRKSGDLTKKAVCSVTLNSGVLGLAIALLWYTKFQDNIYFLIGVCVIAGLGGMTTIDFVLAAIQRGGLSIKLGKGGAEVAGISLEDEAKSDG